MIGLNFGSKTREDECSLVMHRSLELSFGVPNGYNPLRPLDPLAQSPCLGPVVSKMLEGRRDPAMPRYVASATNVYGGGSASLGAAYLPFVVSADPNDPKFAVNNLSLSGEVKDRLAPTEMPGGLGH